MCSIRHAHYFDYVDKTSSRTPLPIRGSISQLRLDATNRFRREIRVPTTTPQRARRPIWDGTGNECRVVGVRASTTIYEEMLW